MSSVLQKTTIRASPRRSVSRRTPAVLSSRASLSPFASSRYRRDQPENSGAGHRHPLVPHPPSECGPVRVRVHPTPRSSHRRADGRSSSLHGQVGHLDFPVGRSGNLPPGIRGEVRMARQPCPAGSLGGSSGEAIERSMSDEASSRRTITKLPRYSQIGWAHHLRFGARGAGRGGNRWDRRRVGCSRNAEFHSRGGARCAVQYERHRVPHCDRLPGWRVEAIRIRPRGDRGGQRVQRGTRGRRHG
jgi:hypothetical protein